MPFFRVNEASQSPRQKTILVTTFNADGLKSNLIYVQLLLSKCDILCIQEHWLLSYEAKEFDTLFPNHNFVVKCVDDDIPMPPKQRRRGTAGTATIWKKELDHLIIPLNTGSDILIIVQLTSADQPIAIINN